MNAMLGCAVLLTLGLPLTAQGATTVAKGTDPTKQVLRGPIVMRDSSVLQGEVVIEGDAITCVAADCPDPPGASVFTIIDAFIFPGFIDAHNHVAYNVLPKWTPPKLYKNRGQWQDVHHLTCLPVPTRREPLSGGVSSSARFGT
jgi:hypothetical protein